jgi:hypothetical protein
MDIVKTVTDWPVIVQGALGSALFWAILELGQRGLRKLTSKVSSDNETANWFALASLEASPPMIEKARYMCLYAALHYLLKASIVSVLSVAVSSFVDVFAIVGYLIAVYYLFRALAYVPHIETFGPIKERPKKFQDSLKALAGEKKLPDAKGKG